MPLRSSRRGRSYASPRVSFVSQQKGADAFKHACFRLGRQPANEVLADLRDHGALVLDVQLCRDLEPVLIFLKEAPLGIHQVMIYDGYLFFGAESSYQEKLRATRHRMPQSVLKDQVQLWRFMRALTAFSSLRGTGLAVLELTGLPIYSVTSLLARTLSQTPSLQRLHLEGCGLHDRGLVQLLPHLSRRLAKLSHLSLAQNSLRDLRLVARLLQARAGAQQKRQVVPLNVLDLSKNPWLGATRRPGLGRGAIRSWRREQSTLPVSREDLLRVICLALRNGLVVKKIRLRNMGLRRDDLRPLQQLLRAELANLHAGYGRFPFPLAELSLEGNPLDAPVFAAITNALQQLCPGPSYLPAGAWHKGDAPKRPPRRGETTGTTGPVTVTVPQALLPLRRTQSQPHLVEAASEIEERQALSEGDMDDGEVPDRSEIIQEFQEDLQILSAFLESREARPVHRPVRAARTEQRVSMSSEGSGLEIAAIPDMGLEFGFGPPVLHGTYSHTDTPDASLDASAEPTDREHEPGPDSEGQTTTDQSHLRMQAQAMLRQLHLLAAESQRGDVAVAPVLRMALDAVNSETSLQDTEAQLQQLRYETSEDVVETEGEELRRSHSV